MSQKGLFTVGLIAYNEKDYLYEALDSVLEQDYPEIEIIVADDGTPGFDCGAYEKYIEEHKGANIKKYAVYTHEKNAGTVKNCNFIVRRADGEYLLMFAADDALYDAHVVAAFAREFENRGPDCKILSAPVAICTGSLSEVTECVPDRKAQEFVKNSTPRQMFDRLAGTYTIQAGGTCYRTGLFAETGGFDEDYALIEDAPFYIRLARLGYKFGWVDGMAAVRHRDGGISHGNTRASLEALEKYYGDEMLLYEKEVIPYKHLIGEEQYKLAMEKYGYAVYHYYSLFVKHEQSVMRRVLFMKKHGCLKTVLVRKTKEVLKPAYESLCQLCGSLLHVMLVLHILHALCKETDAKRKLVLEKGILFAGTAWMFLNLCSVLKFLRRILKKQEKRQ